MHSKIKSVWKLAAAVMLFFAGAPLYAANKSLPIVQTVGFTEANQGLPFITHKDMTQGAASDGSLTFRLDLLFGTDAEAVYAIQPMIHYNSEKLAIIEISNIAHAGFGKPNPDPQQNRHYTPDMPPLITIAGESVEADTDTAVFLPWADLLEISSVAGATMENPVRVATIKFRWKAGAASASHIGITQYALGLAGDFRGASIAVQGRAITAATAGETRALAGPEPRIVVSKTRITTTEGGGSAEFQVQLNAPPLGEDVVVAVRSSDTGEATVLPALLVFTVDNWNDERSVTVYGEDDDLSDGDQGYKIHLKVDNNKTGAVFYHDKTASVFGTNIDNEAVVTLSVSPACLYKANSKQQVVITATLHNADAGLGKMRVVFSKEGGTATEGADYDLPYLPDSTIINAQEASASERFSITPKIASGSKTIRIVGEVETSDISVGGVAIEPANISVIPVDLRISGPVLDVDANNSRTAQDGIIVMRYLLDVRGEALVDGQANAGDLEKIEAHIAGCRAVFNVDGNQETDDNDGTLIARYFLGLRGDALVKNLSVEIPAVDVEENIKRLWPK